MEGEHPRPHDESDSGRPGAKTPGAEERLRQVGNSYQVALEALLQGDLETAAGALLDSDDLLALPQQELPPGADLRALHGQVTAAHQRLFSTLSCLQAQTLEELTRARRGRQALKVYGDPGRQTGRRVHSRG